MLWIVVSSKKHFLVTDFHDSTGLQICRNVFYSKYKLSASIFIFISQLIGYGGRQYLLNLGGYCST